MPLVAHGRCLGPMHPAGWSDVFTQIWPERTPLSFHWILPPPGGSHGQIDLKGTRVFGVMLLQKFKSVVLHLGCILESEEKILKHQWLELTSAMILN